MRWPIVCGFIGIGIEIVALAAPRYWPNAPEWVWGMLVWLGIFIIVSAIMWGIWPDTWNLLSWRTPTIDLLFSDGPPHKWGNKFRFTGLTVVNKTQKPALNVQVAITDINPRPIYGAFHSELPLYLRPVGEQRANSYTINPSGEKRFVLSRSWISAPPNNEPVININDPMEDNTLNYIIMEQHERWRLRITASSSNAGTATREFSIGVEQARINVRISE